MSEENELKKRGKKSMSKKKKITISILLAFTLVLALILGVYLHVRNTIYVDNYNNDNSTKVTYEEVDGITNILLIGTDARNLDEPARADAIIIATIDNNNKKLKLTSIMRDVVVDVPGYGEEKINAALALGGPELLMDTIKENFNLELNKYVMVNFRGFESIIDSIGGIDVDVKDYEIEEINKYIGEGLSSEKKSEPLENPGMQHLDGQQALAYARIRKVGNGDYERTERQRRVIDIVTQKLEDVSIVKYPSIMYDLLPYIKTNIEPIMMLNYAYTAMKFPSLDFEELRIPSSELISKDVPNYKNLGWVILVDKEQCGKIMHNFIFNDKMPTDEDYNVAMWQEKYNKYMYGNGASINNPNSNTGVPIKPEKQEQNSEIKPNGNINQNKPEGDNIESSPPKGDSIEPQKPKPNDVVPPNPEDDKEEFTKPEGGIVEPEKPSNPDGESGENIVQPKPEDITNNP